MNSEWRAISHLLQKSLEDFYLSSDEKYELTDKILALPYDAEGIAYLRNKAFDLAQLHINTEKNQMALLKWLKQTIKVLDKVKSNYHVEPAKVFFSPGKQCVNNIIDCILNAQQCIHVCVFTISDNRVRDALIAAHKKGIAIRIISDNQKSQDKGSDIFSLAFSGISVRLDVSENHMHHKFVVFDERVLINGSFNWTRSASEYNEENIMLLYEKNMIQKFLYKFEELWKLCENGEVISSS